MIKIKKKAYNIKSRSNIASCLNAAFNDQIIIAYWSNVKKTISNWGDAVNPFIIEKLSGKKVIHVNSIYNIRNKPVYSVIGSILQHSTLSKINKLIIWGSGVISNDKNLVYQNAEIHAVRGPLTRERLVQSGYKCPEVYGDPVLLFPILYPKKTHKKFKLGIIPHYVDYDNKLIDKLRSDKDILIISVNSEITRFVDQVLSCEVIASSSLHGLILADAYNIPSVWIKFSDKIVGGDFKFQDYFLSVGRNNEKPLIIDYTTDKNLIINSLRSYDIIFDKQELLEACPFFHSK